MPTPAGSHDDFGFSSAALGAGNESQDETDLYSLQFGWCYLPDVCQQWVIRKTDTLGSPDEETLDNDILLEFLSILNQGAGAVTRYTNSDGEVIYAYVDNDRQKQTLTKFEISYLFSLYAQDQKERVMPELFERLPAGGGEAQENWAGDNRYVPWSSSRLLAKMYRENYEKTIKVITSITLPLAPLLSPFPDSRKKPELTNLAFKQPVPKAIIVSGQRYDPQPSEQAKAEEVKARKVDFTKTGEPSGIISNQPLDGSPDNGGSPDNQYSPDEKGLLPTEVFNTDIWLVIINYLDDYADLLNLQRSHSEFRKLMEAHKETRLQMRALRMLNAWPEEIRKAHQASIRQVFTPEYYRDQLRKKFGRHPSFPLETIEPYIDRPWFPYLLSETTQQALRSDSAGLLIKGEFISQYQLLGSHQFSPDGTQLISTTYHLRLLAPYNLRKFRVVKYPGIIQLGENGVWKASAIVDHPEFRLVIFSPDNVHLATISHKRFSIWRKNHEGKVTEVIHQPGTKFDSVAFSPDANTVLATDKGELPPSGYTVHIFRYHTNAWIGECISLDNNVDYRSEVLFSPCSNYALCQLGSRQLYLINLMNPGHSVAHLMHEMPDKGMMTTAFSFDSQYLFISDSHWSHTSLLHIWKQTTAGQYCYYQKILDTQINAISQLLSSTCRPYWLVSTDEKRAQVQIRVLKNHSGRDHCEKSQWQLVKDLLVSEINPNPKGVVIPQYRLIVRLSPDNQCLAIAFHSKILIISLCSNGELGENQMLKQNAVIHGLAFSPNALLLACRFECSVSVWHMGNSDNGQRVAVKSTPQRRLRRCDDKSLSDVHILVFSPDSRHLINMARCFNSSWGLNYLLIIEMVPEKRRSNGKRKRRKTQTDNPPRQAEEPLAIHSGQPPEEVFLEGFFDQFDTVPCEDEPYLQH